jgi:hypothetical protein
MGSGDSFPATNPASGAPSANEETRRKCGGCQQPIHGNDRFCRYCGYSQRKCAVCGWRFPQSADDSVNAGQFCPSCGAARARQQVIRNLPSSSRLSGISSFAKNLAAPVAVVVIAALVLAQPTVPRSTAQAFFDRYYSEVTNGGQRGRLYTQDLTTSFRQLPKNSPEQYNGFWRTIGSVSIDSVSSVPGNSYEFTVSLMLYPRANAT